MGLNILVNLSETLLVYNRFGKKKGRRKKEGKKGWEEKSEENKYRKRNKKTKNK